MAWNETSEFFAVGDLLCPAGRPAALAAIRAKRLGDSAGVLRNARLAMEADQEANDAQAAARVLQRGNVSGNAWSAFFESVTGLSLGTFQSGRVRAS